MSRPACAECGRPALDPAEDTLAGAPICAVCLSDYLAENGQEYPVTHYCTYCDYYSRSHVDGTLVPGSTVYVGTRRQVMTHANIHPLGAPSDMVLPLSDWAPYPSRGDK